MKTLTFYFIAISIVLLSCSKEVDIIPETPNVSIDYSSDSSIISSVMKFHQLNPDYSPPPQSFLKSGNTDSTQVIHLNQGYNMVSSYLVPDTANVEYMFRNAPIIVMIAENKVWWKNHNVNTIGDWDSNTAYKIKMQHAYDLVITGNKVQLPKTLSLHAGINYLPVLVTYPIKVEQLFAGSMQDVILIVGMDPASLYMPELNINTLNYLYPGKGYFLVLLNPITITYF